MGRGRKQSNWRGKLHPAFFELALLYRKSINRQIAIESETKRALKALNHTAPPELVADILKRRQEEIENLSGEFDEKVIEIDARYKPLPERQSMYPWLQAARTGPLDSELWEISGLEWLHSERHHESRAAATRKADAGDLSALRRLQRSEEDYFRLLHKRGPLKGFLSDNAYHRDLLQLVFCFGGENLTNEELADCFEEYCPCGKYHSAEALKKQRSRLMREFQEDALDQTWNS